MDTPTTRARKFLRAFSLIRLLQVSRIMVGNHRRWKFQRLAPPGPAPTPQESDTRGAEKVALPPFAAVGP